MRGAIAGLVNGVVPTAVIKRLMADCIELASSACSTAHHLLSFVQGSCSLWFSQREGHFGHLYRQYDGERGGRTSNCAFGLAINYDSK